MTSALIKGNLHNQMQAASPNKNVLLLSNKKLKYKYQMQNISEVSWRAQGR